MSSYTLTALWILYISDTVSSFICNFSSYSSAISPCINVFKYIRVSSIDAKGQISWLCICLFDCQIMPPTLPFNHWICVFQSYIIFFLLLFNVPFIIIVCHFGWLIYLNLIYLSCALICPLHVLSYSHYWL